MPAPTVTSRLAASTSSTTPTVVVAVGLELLERHAPAALRHRPVLTGQPQQDAPRDGLLGRVEARVRRLGEPRDGAAHAAGALVGGEREEAAVAPLPQLEQGSREQRQRARLELDVGQQPVDELRLDV